MSDYGSTLSEFFGESLDKHLTPIVDKQACMDGPQQESVYESFPPVIELMDRVLQDWFRAMEPASREEVSRLFEEMKEVSVADFIGEMRARGMSSPFELLATFFRAPECPEEEVVEIIEPATET